MNKEKSKMSRRAAKFSMILVLILLAFCVASKLTDIPFIGIEVKEFTSEWSIGIYKIYRDGSTLKASPHPGVSNPVLTAKDITDRKATRVVADPFLVYENDIFYMFFEVLDGDNIAHDNLDIGLAVSKDGLEWKYDRIILDETFGLSYPHVFKWKESYYMIPESSQVNSVRLYKAKEFPYHWEFVKTLLRGKDFVDPTILQYEDKCWIFASNRSNDNLYLYYSDDLIGPWTEHPKSPIIKGDKNIARPGGNFIHIEGDLIRIAQDDCPSYGNSVRAFKIVKLDTQEYKEIELKDSPLLESSGKGWNKDGMHQLSVCQNKDEFIAVVDGQKFHREYHLYIKLPEKIGGFLKNIAQ